MSFPKAMYKLGVAPHEQDGVAVTNEGEETLLRGRGWIDGVEFFADLVAAEKAEAERQAAIAEATIKAEEKEAARLARKVAEQQAIREAAQKQQAADEAALIRRQTLDAEVNKSLTAPLERELSRLKDHRRSLESEHSRGASGWGNKIPVFERLTEVQAKIATVQEKLEAAQRM